MIDVLISNLRASENDFRSRGQSARGEAARIQIELRRKVKSRADLIVADDTKGLARLDAEIATLEADLAQARGKAEVLADGNPSVFHALSQKTPTLEARQIALELQAASVAEAERLISEAQGKLEALAALRQQILDQTAEVIGLMQEARQNRGAAWFGQHFLPQGERLALPKYADIWDSLRRLSIEGHELEAVIGQRPAVSNEGRVPIYQRTPNGHELAQLAGNVARREMTVEQAADIYGLDESTMRGLLRTIPAPQDLSDVLTAAMQS